MCISIESLIPSIRSRNQVSAKQGKIKLQFFFRLQVLLRPEVAKVDRVWWPNGPQDAK